MGDRSEKGTLFRAEALDEFSSRTRGEVLQLPALKAGWIALLCALWGASLISLLSLLPWHESLLIDGRLDSAADGHSVVTFLVPAHISRDFGDQVTDMFVDERPIRRRLVISDAADWLPSLLKPFNISERYKIVAWTVTLEDANDRAIRTCRLSVSSSTLIDVLIFKLASELHGGSKL